MMIASSTLEIEPQPTQNNVSFLPPKTPEPEVEKKSIIPFAVASLVVAGVITLEILYRKSIIDQSIKFTMFLQSYGDAIVDFCFKVMAGLVNPGGMGAFYVIHYTLSREKHKVLVNLLNILIVIFLGDLFKLVYANPRPYFISEELVAKECDTGFGNPSGHAFTGSFFYTSFAINLFLYSKTYKKTRFVMRRKNTMRDRLEAAENSRRRMRQIFAVVVFSFIVNFSIGFSRIYNAVHTVNQVILGWTYGIFCCFMFMYYINDYLEAMVLGMATRTLRFKAAIYGALLVFFVFSIVVPWIFYGKAYVSDDWIKTILIKCPKANISNSAQKTWTNTSIIMIGFGLLIGIMFSKGVYDHDHMDPDEELGIRDKTKILRLVTLGALMGLIFTLRFFPNPKENIFIEYCIRFALNYFLLGFAVTFILPLLLNKFDLETKYDFMRVVSDPKASKSI